MNKFNINATVLLVFLLGFLPFASAPPPVGCGSSGILLTCSIDDADETLIHNTIASSFEPGNTKLNIVVYSGGAGVTFNISLPENITELTIENRAGANVFVETYTVNSEVDTIDLDTDLITIKQVNFFAFFPNLQDVYAYDLRTVFFPIFAQNKQLTKIYVENSQTEDVPSRYINHTIFGGLDKLEYLEWTYGDITGIKAGSFKGVNKLTRLDLFDNKIQELESCTFEELEKLERLSFSVNRISIVDPNAFLGLNSLTKLNLYDNPSMPLTAITVLKNLEELDVGKIDPTHILPEITQQLNKLTHLILLRSQFNCTCDTEWISKLNSFGITVNTSDSTCMNDTRKVTNSSLYTSCGARSYQCFNKSIECVGENWNRVDTVDGCECVYPEESYSASEICNDINECEDSAICQGNCINTPGSYKCSCLEGYYNANDTLCSDIDECLLFNGNCTHNCSNAIGSYECSCLTGYHQLGFSDCVDIDECLLFNANCSHNCSNAIGSYECSCLTGYQQLGFSDCVDINECLLLNGNCSHVCNNAIGSYECSCLPGYLKNASTDCYLPDPCSTNNGGCHHNCTDGIYAYACSCLEGFKVSPSNISHCVPDLNVATGEQNENAKTFALYVLLFVCFLFLVTIILLFTFLLLVFLYLSRQIQQLKSTRSPKALSLAEMDRNKQRDTKMKLGDKDLIFSNSPQGETSF